MSVAIAAVAARNSLGNGWAPIGAAVRAGVSRVRQHERLTDPLGDPLYAAYCEGLGRLTSAASRMGELGARTLHDLRTELGPACEGQPPVVVALPAERPGFGAAQADEVLRRIRVAASDPALGPPLGEVGRVALDHAGGLQALVRASVIATGHPTGMCIAGGVESFLDAKTLANRQQMLGGRGRNATGEGAAFVLVVAGAARAALAGRITATILGTGLAREAHAGPEDEQMGVALDEAVRAAVQAAPAGPVIGRVLCDINEERWRSEDWGFAALRCGQLFENPARAEMPAGLWGDLGAATGASLVALASHGWARTHILAERCLVLCSSRTGERCAVLLGRP